MAHLYTSPIIESHFFGLDSDCQLHTVVSQLRAILLTAFMLDYGSFLYFGIDFVLVLLAIVLYSRASTKQSFRASSRDSSAQLSSSNFILARFFSLRDRRVCSLKRLTQKRDYIYGFNHKLILDLHFYGGGGGGGLPGPWF